MDQARPYVFNHKHGQLTVYAYDAEEAMKKGETAARGMQIKPCFSTQEKETSAYVHA